MFTDRLCKGTEHLGLPTIEINTTMNENESAERVTQAFGL
jgi:hypothetical protein